MMTHSFEPDLDFLFSRIIDMRLPNLPENPPDTVDAYLDEVIPSLLYDPTGVPAPVYPPRAPENGPADLSMQYLSLSVGQDPAIPIPSYFDLHLEPDLRLKRVKSFPRLPMLFEKMLSQSICGQALSGTISSEHLLSLSSRINAQFHSAYSVANESDIPAVMAYWERSAAQLAANVFPHSDSWDTRTSCVTWNSAGTNAFVNVHPEFAPGSLESDPLTAKSSISSKLHGVSDVGLSNIIVFNFKRIGRPFDSDLFKAIQAIADGHVRFAWTPCSIPGCSPQCRMPGTNEATLSGSRTGVDSDKMTDLLLRLEQDFVPPSLDYTSTCAQISPEMIHKAHYLLQELWATAVDVDATFVVLNSGNEEVVGVRHREMQTLYLSETLDVSRRKGTRSTVKVDQDLPTHLRGRCGLILWSLHDAVDRAINLIQENNLPERVSREYDNNGLRTK